MHTITYRLAKKKLAEKMQEVVTNQVPVLITRPKGEGCVLMPESLYNSLEETAYLLRCPANARHLMDSIEELRLGKGVEVKELLKPN